MDAKLLQRTKDDLGLAPESVPIAENNEPLVALVNSERLQAKPIWQAHPRSLEGQLYKRYIRENPEYNSIFVRSSVAKMLQKAASNLPSNWRLVVAAGHRPLGVQQALHDYVYSKLRSKYPMLSNEEVATTTRLYVADPSRKSPPHCCGSAVDVDVFDARTNQLVDFGSPINTDSKKSHIYNARGQALKNRLSLLEAMLSAGFSSLHSEWWHFSYGDQNWAAFYSKTNAIYGLAEPSITNS